MAITKVVPNMFAVANGEIVSGVTVGNTTSIAALTFDENGVIVAASNVTVTVANTNITGTITNDQIAGVANTKITGNITSSQIQPDVVLQGNVKLGAVTFTNIDGTSGQALVTNGAGNVTFGTIPVGLNGSQGFTSPGTFTAPPTVNKVYVMLQAGGGGGTGYNFSNQNGGGSGGGGGAAIGVVPVTAGSPYPVTVGAGGNAGGPNTPVAGTGGASSFSNLISANGGAGGQLSGGGGAAGNGTAPTGVGVAGSASPGPAVGIGAFGGNGGKGVDYQPPGGPFFPGGAGQAGYVFVAF